MLSGTTISLFFKKRMKILLICCSIVLIAACNNVSKNTAGNVDSIPGAEATAATTDTLEQGCYSYIYQKDTASMQVEVHGPHVTGSLKYKFFEKDQNDGTFEGEVKNGILSGWYLFRSEGVMSVRQVAWRIRGNRLEPGYGPETQRNDTAMFANPATVVFDTLTPFLKAPCII